jgi:membrane associated rhomboid family serine protease
MLPLYDEDLPSLTPPYVTVALIFINILIFAAISFSSQLIDYISKYGIIPKVILGGGGFLTLFTSLFLHRDLIHLIENMWVLWIFGDNLENNLGHWRYLLFYILVGLIAGITHVLVAPSGILSMPVIGASGAISGVMGGYIILFPKNKIKALLLYILISVPAFIYIGIWFFYQLRYTNTLTSIAYTAHIGGFIAGILLILIFKRQITKKDYIQKGIGKTNNNEVES